MDERASSDCLSLVELERLAGGAERDADVERHLETCAACRELLEEVRDNNELFGRLASATGRLSAPGEATAGPPTAPGYEIIGEMHRGGQGIVYRAVQRSTKRPVALKMLLHGSFSTTRQRWRFEREIETVAGLRHPGIVTVYESGVTPDGRPYYAMELVEGEPLDRALPPIQSATPGGPGAVRSLIERRLRVFLRVCDAVAFAHRHGVIHRDLKPSNVIVDAHERPRVLDFGVAKALGVEAGSERTIAGEFMGTLAYASPEQLAGTPSKIDTRCDVYTLGVMLFELLTDRRPFESDASLAEMIRAIAESRPPRPSSLGPSLNDDLDTIVLKALEKHPEHRYQSVDELAGDVRRYIAGEPIEAKRDRTWYVIRKTARRHAWPISIGAAIVVALAAVAVSTTVLYRRAQLEATKANTMRVFLEDTLGSVPEGPDKSEVALRTVLDEAVQWVDIALSDQPEIAASLRITIGNSYRNLGLLDRAERQITEALETRRAMLGPHHPDTATCLNALGLVRTAQGRLDLADRALRQALEIRADHFGPRHLTTAMSHMNIARLERARGDLDDAERSLRRCLEIRAERLGPEHPDVAMCLFELASIRADRGDPGEAERLHRRALDIRNTTLPPGHPDLARSHTALGLLLERRGDLERAETHLVKALALLRATFGDEHPGAALASDRLAEFYERHGREEDAARLRAGRP